MRMLHAAAVSACLEMKVGAEKTLPIGTITVYLSPTGRVCPDGKDPYPAFSVINGPTCPQGHKFMPGVPRPLKATDPKTAALYLASGLTNLVEIDPKHWADPIWAPLLHELGLTNSVNDANGTEELNR